MKKNTYKIFLLLLILTSFTLIYTSCKRHHDFNDLTNGKIGDSSNNCSSCSTCTNGVKDGSETGIDCGGAGCTACTSTCTTAYNTTIVDEGGFSNSSAVYGYYYGSTNDSNHVFVYVANSANADDVTNYDIYLGSNSFSSMAVGDQRVYTTVNPSVTAAALTSGQASVQVTINGFNTGSFYTNAGSHIYFKKINSTTVAVSFCSIPATINTFDYNFSVAVQF